MAKLNILNRKTINTIYTHTYVHTVAQMAGESWYVLSEVAQS